MPGGEAWRQKLGPDLSEFSFAEVREAHFMFEGHGCVVRREPYVFRVV